MDVRSHALAVFGAATIEYIRINGYIFRVDLWPFPTPRKAMQASTVFKALSDPLRLRIMHLLAVREDLCVCELTETLEMPQSSISRHLSLLRHQHLVDTYREGRWIHYRLPASTRPPLTDLLPLLRNLGRSEAVLARDLARLEQVPPAACRPPPEASAVRRASARP